MKKWIWPVLAFFMVLAGSYLAGWLLMPVRTEYGSTWESYLQEPENTIDILVYGSSIAYCDVIPAVFWEETGNSAYVMAGPEQTIPLTYYYLRQTCQTQSPQTIFVELTGMFYNQYQNFTKVNVGYMPWSPNRLAATFRAAEQEERFGLLFPLYTYHTRWKEVTAWDLKSHLQPEQDPMAGYTFLSEAKPNPEIKDRPFSCDTPTYRENLTYLEKIAEFCQKQDIQIVAFVAPAAYRIPETERRQLRQDVEKLQTVHFLDCTGIESALSVNRETDWYDTLHFNAFGAEKFTRYLAAYAKEQSLLPENSRTDAALWQRRLEEFQEKTESMMEKS